MSPKTIPRVPNARSATLAECFPCLLTGRARYLLDTPVGGEGELTERRRDEVQSLEHEPDTTFGADAQSRSDELGSESSDRALE